MEEGVWLVTLEDVPDADGIRNVGHQRHDDATTATLDQLLLDLEELNLGTFDEEERPRRLGEDLAAEFAPDGASRSGDSNDLISDQAPDAGLIECHGWAAQEILDKLNRLYGEGSFNANVTYNMPIDQFVRGVTYGEYEMQPEVARSDVYSVLERGFREGLLLDDEKVLEEALKYARGLTQYFREARYNDFVNKFGEGRMKDLLGELDESIPAVLTKVLLDTSQPLLDRLIIFRKAPEDLRAIVYDRVRPALEMEFQRSRLASSNLVFANLAPEPAGIEEVRKAQAAAAKRKAEEREEANRAEAERK
jgi:hypothetical protein